MALLVWWVIDRSRFGTGLKAIREDEDKAQALGVPTFTYKLIAFVVSAFFTALGGGLYALWFGFLDPIFQFSILVGAYMVLMSLLGGMRSLFGPLLGAVIVGYAVEFFKVQYGDTAVPPRRDRSAARPRRALHARRDHPRRTGPGRPVPPAGETSIREVSAGRARRAASTPRHRARPGLTAPPRTPTHDRPEGASMTGDTRRRPATAAWPPWG